MEYEQIKAIIFDMGGVLIKTTNQQSRTDLAREFGLSYVELEHLFYASPSARRASRGEITEEEHSQLVFEQLGAPEYDLRSFREAFWGGDELDLELIDFIRELKSDYKIGMLSNAMSFTRTWLNEKYNFLHLFDIVYFSAELRLEKPEPAYYWAILKALKVTPQQAIFVDDFIENIRAAEALGIHAIQYKNTVQVITAINQILGR